MRKIILTGVLFVSLVLPASAIAAPTVSQAQARLAVQRHQENLAGQGETTVMRCRRSIRSWVCHVVTTGAESSFSPDRGAIWSNYFRVVGEGCRVAILNSDHDQFVDMPRRVTYRICP